MSEGEFKQYPRMLYKLGGPNSQDVWGHKMDTLVVKSIEEEKLAQKKGWSTDPKKIVKKSIRKNKITAVWSFYCKNWQWFWGTAIAVTLAIILN